MPKCMTAVQRKALYAKTRKKAVSVCKRLRLKGCASVAETTVEETNGIRIPKNNGKWPEGDKGYFAYGIYLGVYNHYDNVVGINTVPGCLCGVAKFNEIVAHEFTHALHQNTDRLAHTDAHGAEFKRLALTMGSSGSTYQGSLPRSFEKKCKGPAKRRR